MVEMFRAYLWSGIIYEKNNFWQQLSVRGFKPGSDDEYNLDR